MLPSLCKDFNISERYHKLSSLLPNGSIILILGTGEKNNFYKEYFSSCKVITSDVHGLFDVDYIFDGHNIPFKDNNSINQNNKNKNVPIRYDDEGEKEDE